MILSVATVLLSVPAQSQAALQLRPEFASALLAPIPARYSPPAAVKWGMAIGGVTGATVGGLIASRHHCDGENCVWGRGLVMVLGIGGGAVVGILAGGAIGHAIAEHSEFDLRESSIRVGFRLSP
ncbi:MAG TPA: hypothetical protein VN953_07395 [Gemmatimonadales bacterium]|nr:hypothetical protein [Gemmatimonadales bacterium]